ncbi:MurR/RpiR family transcriptional regulator [Microbacterium allomyrinae]|uniref:MurR/RpiR family transcriptional regulator n=1 Tax=Microbacterium allomyrinae TaxID=2830666 RepID=A0A9X1LV77_9MICO|nr:MurR/RpiR family transcriptional regulator [Microbacterium allomyrinae]MCC2032635.1 MurR/RpiR family transcriptional regulator [Microbacterium allomyrinae]
MTTRRQAADQLVDGPQTFADLVELMRHRRLTPSQQRIAAYVLADPEGVAFMTISELASVTNVNEATVVRFATAMGVSGYPGLVRLCRQQLRDEAQLLRRFDSGAALRQPKDANLPAVLQLEQANLARTFARIDGDTFEGARDALATAPRVHVLGLRKCHSVAYLAAYLLGLVRADVMLISPGTGMLVEQLGRIRPGDAMLAVSVHRYSRDTVLGVRHAREVGATCISLTDNASSPLALSSEHTFLVDGSSQSMLRSMTAFTALVQALALEVGRSLGTEARQHLEQEEQLLQQLGVYYQDRE